MLVNVVHAEVVNRAPGNVVVNISVNVELRRYSAEEGLIEFDYKIAVSSRIGQVSVSGSLFMFAETEEDRRELRRLAEESKKGVPQHIAQIIVLNSEPLILLIEKEMGMPITPILPIEEPRSGVSLYQ